VVSQSCDRSWVRHCLGKSMDCGIMVRMGIRNGQMGLRNGHGVRFVLLRFSSDALACPWQNRGHRLDCSVPVTRALHAGKLARGNAETFLLYSCLCMQKLRVPKPHSCCTNQCPSVLTGPHGSGEVGVPLGVGGGVENRGELALRERLWSPWAGGGSPLRSPTRSATSFSFLSHHTTQPEGFAAQGLSKPGVASLCLISPDSFLFYSFS